MAINLPIVTQFSDKGIKSAKAAFANFKTDVSSATGAMGKFKAGGNSALNAVKANAGNFAMVAGTAIATFAVKAVGDFQTLALESSKFANATGLTVQEASRFKEVGDDIGIGSDAIQTAIGKMNKTLGTSPELFSKLGIDVVKTETGLTDVNGTFLAVIDRLNGIEDPAERARVAAQLLGKGWAEMAQFVEMGSYNLSKALDNVSDSKIIDPEEVAQAKKLRATMDTLKDSIDDITLTVGEGLAPALSDAAGILDKISSISGVFDKLPGVDWLRSQTNFISPAATAYNFLSSAVGGLVGVFTDAPEKVKVYATELRNAREDQDSMLESLKKLKSGGLDQFVSRFDDAATAIASADTEWGILRTNLEETIALRDLKTQLTEVEKAAAKAFASGKDSDIQDYLDKQLLLVTGLGDVATGMDAISTKEILLAFKTSGAKAAIDLAIWLSKGAELSNLTIDQLLTMGGVSTTIPPRANGGPVLQGSSYLVGERGPEIFTPSGSGMITPNSAIGGGGNTITVNVQGADPQAVVRALQDYNRIAGPIPVNTRAN